MRKELYLPYFKNKKVTVMGLGLLGRGIGDTKFLAESGADIIVTDKKTEEDLATSLLALKDFSNITYHLGGHELADFEYRDYILKAAGVPYDSEYLAHAKQANIPIYMSAALVCKLVMEYLPNVTIIGVTGTRGKSTTTELIAHILRTNSFKVHVGGNVRGVANLPLLSEVEEDEYLVLELDSWQLQGFHELRISPHIAVFTSFMDDHMNYYKNDRDAYFNDKAAIYRYQGEDDVLITTAAMHKELAQRNESPQIIIADEEKEGIHFDMQLIGEHNQSAARLAYEVATQCGLFDDEIRASIASFKAVEGRLQDIGLYKAKAIMGSEGRSPDSRVEFRGVRVFNDNNGTTGDATAIALSSIVETYKKKPILIVGGADKGLSLESLEHAIKEMTKSVIYLTGTGTARITLPKEYEYEDLRDCVKKAFEISEDGDIILFSPAFASFSSYFKNEYERNDVFLESVDEYR